MEIYNTLNLKQIVGGTKIKQGDFGSVLSYSLTNENEQEITSFDKKTAYVNLVLDGKIIFTTTTIVDISRVTFHIDKAIPVGLYYLEIKIDDYIFPSDKDTIILIEEGATAYDLKDLIPNYDVAMTITGILSDLSQKGINITDLQNKMNAIYSNALSDHAEILNAKETFATLDSRLDEIEQKEATDYTDLNNKITTNATTIASTSSRLDGIIANAGNGTIPSEVIAMRTTADNYTYATANAMSNDLSDMVFNTMPLPFTLTQNGYIYPSTGGVSPISDTRFYYSDKINVRGAKFIRLDSKFSTTSDGYAFLDASGGWISGSNVYASKLVVPANAVYFRFTAFNTDISKVRLFGIYSLPDIQKRVYALEKSNPVIQIPFTLTQKKFISYNNGVVADTTSESMYASNMIDISYNKKLNINTAFYSYGGYAFYDKNKVYITGNNQPVSEITVPENAQYFAFTVYNVPISDVTLSGDYKVADLTPTIKKAETYFASGAKQELPTNFAYAIGKALMIGDSLTSGAYYDGATYNGSSINQNIPYYLGKMINEEVKNGGKSGWYPSNWYTSELPNHDVTQYDSFFIWLGTNKGLTNTLDADVNAYSDYNQFAATETGYYCRLIEYIKQHNPDAAIHLSTCFATTGNLAETNLTIRNIATKYDLHVIDLSDLNVASHPELHLNNGNTHFGKAGNIYIANRIIQSVNDYYNSNPIKLEFGLTDRID